MTTLITGASGFVGLALTEHLLSAGQTVIACDLAEPRGSAIKAFSRLPGRLVIEALDVRDGARVREVVRRHAPQRMVTLAAITADARRERASPASIFEVNVNGAIHAIAAGAECGVSRFLHVSSGSVYGASGNGQAPLHETRTPLLPEGLYGISKQAAEAAALRLASLHDLDLTVGRLGTCFGPWEADTGVRDTLSAPLQVLELARQGVPAQLPRPGRRDWLYVRDAAAALDALLSARELAQPVYNVAAGFEWSVADWCEQLARRNPCFSWRLASEPADANVSYYAPYDRASMCIEALRRDTGFTPRFDLPAAAEDFHSWSAACGPTSLQDPGEMP